MIRDPSAPRTPRKSPAQNKALNRKRKRAKGLIQMPETWLLPEQKQVYVDFVRQLQFATGVMS